MTRLEFVAGLLAGVSGYLAAGVVFAAAFHARGIARVDPATRGAGIVFRALVTPGIVLLWPALLARWHRVASGGGDAAPVPGDAGAFRLARLHAWAWRVLAIAGPALLAAAWLAREGDR